MQWPIPREKLERFWSEPWNPWREELMRKRRGVGEDVELTSGPGKLTEAIDITGLHHGMDLTDPGGELFILPGRKVGRILRSHRIGAREDLPEKLSFYEAGGPFASRRNGGF